MLREAEENYGESVRRFERVNVTTEDQPNERAKERRKDGEQGGREMPDRNE